MAGQASGNAYFDQGAKRVAADWRTFKTRFVSSPVLPSLVMAALEMDGNDRVRVELLREIAATYRERSLRRMDWWSLMMPLLGLVLAGCFVIIVVIACFAPLLSMLNYLG
jgi:type II secretory pathway component PulF